MGHSELIWGKGASFGGDNYSKDESRSGVLFLFYQWCP